MEIKEFSKLFLPALFNAKLTRARKIVLLHNLGIAREILRMEREVVGSVGSWMVRDTDGNLFMRYVPDRFPVLGGDCIPALLPWFCTGLPPSDFHVMSDGLEFVRWGE